jgi:hypothetical protein
MKFKRSILIAVALLALSCQKPQKPKITTNYEVGFEILNGKVKQLSETYKYYNEPTTSIIDFDVHGNAVQKKSKGGCDCLIKYEYRHDKNGKKTEIITHNSLREYFYLPVYKYDTAGRIVESDADTKELIDAPPWNTPKQDKNFYKYDTAGDMVQCDGYLDTLHKYVDKYRYDARHILIETDHFFQVRLNDRGPDLLNKRRDPDEKIFYLYKTFDAKGNWLKRVAVEHYSPSFYFGPKPKESVKTNIEVRKITYY